MCSRQLTAGGSYNVSPLSQTSCGGGGDPHSCWTWIQEQIVLINLEQWTTCIIPLCQGFIIFELIFPKRLKTIRTGLFPIITMQSAWHPVSACGWPWWASSQIQWSSSQGHECGCHGSQAASSTTCLLESAASIRIASIPIGVTRLHPKLQFLLNIKLNKGAKPEQSQWSHLSPPQEGAAHASFVNCCLELAAHGEILVHLSEPILPGKERLGEAGTHHAGKNSSQELKLQQGISSRWFQK